MNHSTRQNTGASRARIEGLVGALPKTLTELFALTVKDDHRTAIVQAGALPPLVKCLAASSSDQVAENAAGTLWNLAAGCDTRKVRISESGAIPELIALLSTSKNDNVKRRAAGALANLAASDDIREQVVREGAVPKLVANLDRRCSEGLNEQAAAALWNLSIGPIERMDIIVAAGAIPKLVALLNPALPHGVKRRAAGTIASLAAGNGRILDKIVAAGALGPLVQLLDGSFPDKVKEQAAFSLWNLSIGQMERAQVVADAGAIPKLVELLDVNLPHGLKRRAAGTLVNLAGAGSLALQTQVVEHGAVPKFVALLNQDTSHEILKQACWVLRNICYATPLRAAVRDAGVVALLRRIAEVPDPKLAEAREKAAAALLFLDTDATPPAPSADSDPGYIMISYQRDAQSKSHKIREALQRRGYSVWMRPVARAEESVHSMAEQVAGAGVLLVAASEKYQSSDYCQLEATYAEHCGKKTVFLTMDKGAQLSDGWLAAAVAGGESVAFESASAFAAAVDSLVAKLGATGKGAALPMAAAPESKAARFTPIEERVSGVEKQGSEVARIVTAHGKQLSSQLKTIDVHGASLAMQQQVLDDQRRFIDLQQRTLVEQRDMIEENQRSIDTQRARIMLLENRRRRCTIS